MLSILDHVLRCTLCTVEGYIFSRIIHFTRGLVFFMLGGGVTKNGNPSWKYKSFSLFTQIPSPSPEKNHPLPSKVRNKSCTFLPKIVTLFCQRVGIYLEKMYTPWCTQYALRLKLWIWRIAQPPGTIIRLDLIKIYQVKKLNDAAYTNLKSKTFDQIWSNDYFVDVFI